MKKIVIGLTMAIALICGDETSEELSIMSLEELLDVNIKTGSFLELELRKTPFSMTVIDKSQIESYGGKSLSDLLEIYVPSFQFMSNKWNGTSWGMRGVAGDQNDKIIVLVDGIKQNMQSYQGFATEYSLGLMSDIERIEILRGPAGLAYGSGAIVGVVNIVTKDKSNMQNYVSVKSDYRIENGFIGKSVEGGISMDLKEGHSITVNAGFRNSKGLGENTTKVFGFYELGANPVPQKGNYTAGSFGKTDGNWLGSIKYDFHKFQLFGRVTRQIDQVAPLFYPAPWPSIPDSTEVVQWIKDQKFEFEKTDNYHMFWLPHRRTHLRDNITLSLNFDHKFGKNSLSVKSSIIGTTNRVVNAEYADQNESILFTTGERKFNLESTLLLKPKDKLQVASGLSWGLLKSGDDLSGENSYWIPDMPYIAEITYNNVALYSELFYDINPFFSIEAGARWDLYTDGKNRTDGILSPKLSLLFEPSSQHLFKLIAQSSSNTADVLTYELAPAITTKEKEWTYELADRFGENALDTLTFEQLTTLLGNLLPPISQKEKHATKPERSYNLEVATQHLLNKKILLESSVSYSLFRDLLLWSSTMQQNVSIDGYDALSIELGLKGDFNTITLGANSAIQLPMNFNNRSNKLYTRPLFVPGWNDSLQTWVPTDTTPDGVPVGDTTVYQDIVKNQISADGKYFNNLQTVTTKGYLDWKPLEYLTFHTSARVFWGLWGRKNIHLDYIKEANGDVEFHNQASRDSYFRPTVKWDCSLIFSLPKDLTFSIFAYNLLGNYDSQDAIRWHHMTAESQLGYYSIDQRSFAFKLTKMF